MADEFGKATIKIEGDATQFAAVVDSTAAKVAELKQKAEAAGSAADGNGPAGGAFTGQVPEAARAAERFAAASKFADTLKTDAETKAAPAFETVTRSVSVLRGVLSKLTIPAAFIGAALGVVDLIDKWRTKGEAFRRTLDDVVTGFRNVGAAAEQAGRGGPLGDAQRDIASRTAGAVAAIQAAADAQLQSRGRVLWSILGLDLTTEEVAAETQKRIDAVAAAAAEQARVAANRAKEERQKRIEDERAAAEAIARDAEIATMDTTDKIRAIRDRDLEELYKKRNAADDAATITAYNRAIAARSKQADAEINIYLDQKAKEEAAAKDAVNAEIRSLERAAEQEAKRIRDTAEANANAMRQVLTEVNRAAAAAGNTDQLFVAVNKIGELLQVIERQRPGD